MRIKTYLHNVVTTALLVSMVAISIDYLVGVFSATSLETQLGLDFLFTMRGIRPTPDNIAIIAMDEQSESQLALGSDLTRWRQYHAKLIQQLQAQKVALIIFDLQLMTAIDNSDAEIAAAMRKIGSVLLTDCVQKLTGADEDFFGREDCSESHKQPIVVKEAKLEQMVSKSLVAAQQIPATPIIANAALDHAAFILNAAADNEQVRESWLFYKELADAPSLPLVSLLYVLQRQGELNSVSWLKPPFSQTLPELRRLCLSDQTGFFAKLTASDHLSWRLAQLICQDDSVYLNYYGLPGSIRTESYSEVLQGNITDLQDKIIFVGKANRKYTHGRMDVFPTVFATAKTGKMPGVEIMATQFANLQQANELVLPVPFAVPIGLFSVLLAAILLISTRLTGMVLSLFFSAAYVGLAIWCFSWYAWWLPVAVPLIIQLPLTLLVSLWGSLKNWRPASTRSRTVNSVCLATDIVGYTALTAQLSAEQIAELLDGYQQVLNKVIGQNQGKVNDFIGDAMMAYWLDWPMDKQRHFALTSALEIVATVAKYNAAHSIGLPIRIGLCEGELRLRVIRAGDTQLYRAVGNALNIASRIEGVNKHLATKILVTSTMVEDNSPWFFRNVGKFRLLGVKQVIELMEVVALKSEITLNQLAKHQLFNQALVYFQQARWQDARLSLKLLLDEYGFDGPSEYYLKLALEYEKTSPDHWQGYVILDEK